MAVIVRDTGAGMSEEEQQRCFEPFYSTKVLSEGGTGLGLSICNDIVRGHGGKILFESALGVGTEFRMVLPPSRETAPQAPGDEALPARRRVLLVEDEEDVRLVLDEMLRLIGQEVDSVVSAEEALELLARGRYGLVITDQSSSPMRTRRSQRPRLRETGFKCAPIESAQRK